MGGDGRHIGVDLILNSIYVITLDHNASTVSERAVNAQQRWADVPLMCAAGAIREYLALYTCNRSELYLVLPEDDADAEVARTLMLSGARTLCGLEAVHHMLRVLLGLESMARGESHIVAQVKEAYASSSGCGKVLHRLFQRAFGMAATLRSCYHPGREPSIQFIAADHFRKRCEGHRVLVAGLGAFGSEMANLLACMDFDVSITNRTPRKADELDEKIKKCRMLDWAGWKNDLDTYDAVFLCTGAPRPVMSAADRTEMRDGAVLFDLGSPLQSEEGEGVRITLDDLRELAAETLAEYSRLLVRLEEEAARASGALLAEISVLADDTWKHLALARGQSLVRERAEAQAKKLGVSTDELEVFGASILKSYLHPLVAVPAAHSARAWRILSGEGEE